MATAKRTTARVTAPVEEDGDDLLPVAGSAPGANLSPAKKRKSKRPAPPPAGEDISDRIDNDDDGGAADNAPFEMDGLPQQNRRTRELEAQMLSRLSGEPVFPYPPELKDKLKPQWLRLVNSFPQDHFKISDIPLMLVYVQCAYDIERMNILIDEEGEVVLGGRGPIVNPRCKVRDARIASMMGLATKFRNQPASRVNTENFGNRQQKADAAARGAAATADDDDGLLARPGLH